MNDYIPTKEIFNHLKLDDDLFFYFVASHADMGIYIWSFPKHLSSNSRRINLFCFYESQKCVQMSETYNENTIQKVTIPGSGWKAITSWEALCWVVKRQIEVDERK